MVDLMPILFFVLGAGVMSLTIHRILKQILILMLIQSGKLDPAIVERLLEKKPVIPAFYRLKPQIKIRLWEESDAITDERKPDAS